MPNPVAWSGRIDVAGSVGNFAHGQADAQFAVLKNGDIIAVWTQTMPGGGTDIYMQRLDLGGNRIGEVVKVNTTDNGNQEKPVITALDNGGFAIAWLDHSRSDADVRYRAYDSVGTPRTSSDSVAFPNFGNDQGPPAITAVGDGFAISFEGLSSGSGYITSTYTASGASNGWSTSGGGAVEDVAVAMPSGAAYQGRPVTAALLDDNTIAVRLRNDPNAELLNGALGHDMSDVSVTALRDGGFILTWTSKDPAGNDALMAYFYGADGVRLPFPTKLMEASFDLGRVNVAALPDGGFVIAYARFDGVGLAQVFNAAGNASGEVFLTDGRSAPQPPSIAVMNDGRILFGSVEHSNLTLTIRDSRPAHTSTDPIGNDNDRYAGTGFADTLNGGEGDDYLLGGAGNDRISGDQGVNTLDGGMGDDSLFGGDLEDMLYGGEGGDRLFGSEGIDRFFGGAGHDAVTYENSNSPEGIRLNLNDTSDSTYEAKDDIYDGIEAFVGSTGNDTIIGHDTRYNELFGDAGDDTIMAGAAGDRLFGEAGADRLYSGRGADTLMGGRQDGSNDAAYDIVSYQNAAGAITLNHRTGVHAGEAKGDTFRAIDAFVGSTKGDEMIGANGRDDFYGDKGNDSLEGGEGDDILVGEEGDDILFAGAGNDTIYGGRQNDTDTDGWDTVSYQRAGVIVLDFREGQAHGEDAAGDVFFDINAYVGSSHADTMTGAEGGDVFYGDAGNDSLAGGGSGDHLFGQTGDDTLEGGAGNDTLDGGSGINTAIYAGARGEYDIIRHADGSITVRDRDGSEGTDTLIGTRNLQFSGGVKEVVNVAPTNLTLSDSSIKENAPPRAVVGTLSAMDADGDRLTYTLMPGSSSAFAIDTDSNSLVVIGPLDFEAQPNHQVIIQARDAYGGTTSLTVNVTVADDTDETTPFTIRGTPRADALTGEAGNDTIYGSGGNDQLRGEAGHDKLYGGLGKDRMYGGSGKDVFVFDTKLHKSRNVDKIYDFKFRDDSIFLENKVFTKLGKGLSKGKKFKSDMFTTGKKAKDAEDRIVYDKKTGSLYYDQDGTGSKAQVKIATISNKTTLKYHDFFVI